MASLGLIVPLFGKTEEDQLAFANWMKKPKIVKKFNDIGIDDINGGSIFPHDSLDGLGVQYKKICPKANAVYLKLRQLHIDNPTHYDYYVMVDGTGIELEYIFDIIKALKEMPVDVAMACRVGEHKAISKERVEIENFENSILSEVYNTKLPDCQCGCWGFKKQFLGFLSKEGVGFELEIEILMDALENNRPLVFIPVKLKKPIDPTRFKMEDSIQKMKFIMRGLRISKDMLLSFIDRKATDDLDSGYIKKMKEIDVDRHIPQIYCRKDCGKRCFI